MVGMDWSRDVGVHPDHAHILHSGDRHLHDRGHDRAWWGFPRGPVPHPRLGQGQGGRQIEAVGGIEMQIRRGPFVAWHLGRNDAGETCGIAAHVSDGIGDSEDKEVPDTPATALRDVLDRASHDDLGRNIFVLHDSPRFLSNCNNSTTI